MDVYNSVRISVSSTFLRKFVPGKADRMERHTLVMVCLKCKAADEQDCLFCYKCGARLSPAIRPWLWIGGLFLFVLLWKIFIT